VDKPGLVYLIVSIMLKAAIDADFRISCISASDFFNRILEKIAAGLLGDFDKIAGLH
jgi:hypothetical protein